MTDIKFVIKKGEETLVEENGCYTLSVGCNQTEPLKLTVNLVVNGNATTYQNASCFSIETEDDWYEVMKNGTEVRITFENNFETEDRTGSIIIRYDGDDNVYAYLNIVQNKQNYGITVQSDDNVKFKYSDYTLSNEYVYNGKTKTKMAIDVYEAYKNMYISIYDTSEIISMEDLYDENGSYHDSIQSFEPCYMLSKENGDVEFIGATRYYAYYPNSVDGSLTSNYYLFINGNTYKHLLNDDNEWAKYERQYITTYDEIDVISETEYNELDYYTQMDYAIAYVDKGMLKPKDDDNPNNIGDDDSYSSKEMIGNDTISKSEYDECYELYCNDTLPRRDDYEAVYVNKNDSTDTKTESEYNALPSPKPENPAQGVKYKEDYVIKEYVKKQGINNDFPNTLPADQNFRYMNSKEYAEYEPAYVRYINVVNNNDIIKETDYNELPSRDDYEAMYVNINDSTDIKTEREYNELEPQEKENYQIKDYVNKTDSTDTLQADQKFKQDYNPEFHTETEYNSAIPELKLTSIPQKFEEKDIKVNISGGTEKLKIFTPIKYVKSGYYGDGKNVSKEDWISVNACNALPENRDDYEIKYRNKKGNNPYIIPKTGEVEEITYDKLPSRDDYEAVYENGEINGYVKKQGVNNNLPDTLPAGQKFKEDYEKVFAKGEEGQEDILPIDQKFQSDYDTENPTYAMSTFTGDFNVKQTSVIKNGDITEATVTITNYGNVNVDYTSKENGTYPLLYEDDVYYMLTFAHADVVDVTDSVKVYYNEQSSVQ